MGGERSSTTRQRLAGKICARCSRSIDAGAWPGEERLCNRCGGVHKVYMGFFVRGGGEWVCTFLEPDLRTPIGRIRCFGSEEKLRELIARTQTTFTLEDRQALDHATALGRGGVYLQLSGEQYEKLRR
jgi:hypothetical protein